MLGVVADEPEADDALVTTSWRAWRPLTISVYWLSERPVTTSTSVGGMVEETVNDGAERCVVPLDPYCDADAGDEDDAARAHVDDAKPERL